MRLQVNATQHARCFKTIALALMLALSCAACEFDGASKKNVSASATMPAGTMPPRTNLPMPPIESAQQTSAAAATTLRGAWTQLDGRRASLEDLRGQVVILDFWATYCPPCREEIPHLVRFQREFGPKGFKVIGLNVGGADDRINIPDFANQYGMQYQLAEPDEETVRLFLANDRSIPQTFVLDRQGKVVLHIVGFDGDAAAELEQAVTNALSSKPATSDE